MTIREQLHRAIADGRPVLLHLDGGEQVVGVVEEVDERHGERDDDSGYPGLYGTPEPRPPMAKVLLPGIGCVESIDLRRILAVSQAGRAR